MASLFSIFESSRPDSPLIRGDAIVELARRVPWGFPPNKGTALFVFVSLPKDGAPGAIVACYFERNLEPIVIVSVMMELPQDVMLNAQHHFGKLFKHWGTFDQRFLQYNALADGSQCSNLLPMWFNDFTPLPKKAFTHGRRHRAFVELKDAIQEDRVKFIAPLPSAFFDQLLAMRMGSSTMRSQSGEKLQEHLVEAMGCLILAWEDRLELSETAIRHHDLGLITHVVYARTMRSLGAICADEDVEESIPDIATMLAESHVPSSSSSVPWTDTRSSENPHNTTAPQRRSADTGSIVSSILNVPSSSSSSPSPRSEPFVYEYPIRALAERPLWGGSLEHHPDLFVIDVPPGPKAPGAAVACHFNAGGAIVHLLEEWRPPVWLPSSKLGSLCSGPFGSILHRTIARGSSMDIPTAISIDRPTNSVSNVRALKTLRDAIHEGRLRFANTMHCDALPKLFDQIRSLREFESEPSSSLRLSVPDRDPRGDHLVMALSYALLTRDEEEEKRADHTAPPHCPLRTTSLVSGYLEAWTAARAAIIERHPRSSSVLRRGGDASMVLKATTTGAEHRLRVWEESVEEPSGEKQTEEVPTESADKPIVHGIFGIGPASTRELRRIFADKLVGPENDAALIPVGGGLGRSSYKDMLHQALVHACDAALSSGSSASGARAEQYPPRRFGKITAVQLAAKGLAIAKTFDLMDEIPKEYLDAAAMLADETKPINLWREDITADVINEISRAMSERLALGGDANAGSTAGGRSEGEKEQPSPRDRLEVVGGNVAVPFAHEDDLFFAPPRASSSSASGARAEQYPHRHFGKSTAADVNIEISRAMTASLALGESMRAMGAYSHEDRAALVSGLHSAIAQADPASSSATPSPAKVGDGDCAVCLVEKRGVVLVPCGHIVVCEACSKLIRNECPICRARVASVVKFFDT